MFITVLLYTISTLSIPMIDFSSNKKIILSSLGGVVVLGSALAFGLSQNDTDNTEKSAVTQDRQKQNIPYVEQQQVAEQEDQPVDRSNAGDFNLVPSDVVRDEERSVSVTAQNAEFMTQEGYRISFLLPPNNTYQQKVTLSPLKTNPFPVAEIPGMKGTGIDVAPMYVGLSGRPFYKPAWLVFEFAPTERTYDKETPRDFCRPDYPAFDPLRCQNQRNTTLGQNKIFAVNIDTAGKMKARLAPVYQIDENSYAVAALYGGVYIPFMPETGDAEKVAAITELIADTTSNEPTGYLEAARALRQFGLTPGENMQKKISLLPTFQYVGVYYWFLAGETARYFNVSDISAIQRRMMLSFWPVADWPEYFSSIALLKRSYTESAVIPDLFPADVEKAFARKLSFKPPSKDPSKNVQYYHERVIVADAFGEIWQWYEKDRQTTSASNHSRFAALRELIAPSVFAQSTLSPEEYYKKLGESLQDMVNNTGCDAAGRKDLIVIASIAYGWDHDEVADAAVEKLKGCLDEAIEKAPAPDTDGGGSGSGGGSNDSGSGTGCDLVHKNLSNFGINSCGGAAGTLLDLAKEASRIEEDGLASKALSKAGVL